MRQEEIEIGMTVFVKIGDSRVACVVLATRTNYAYGTRRKTGQSFQVKRLDTDRILPKWRPASALHRDRFTKA